MYYRGGACWGNLPLKVTQKGIHDFLLWNAVAVGPLDTQLQNSTKLVTALLLGMIHFVLFVFDLD